MIVGVGRYVLNDVIARDLCIETVEEFIQRIARRRYNITDQGPYEFLRNIAPIHERSPSGRPVLRKLIKKSPPKKPARGLATSSVRYSNTRGREKERYTKVESRREKESESVDFLSQL
ncbi:hypothetical protein EVAR_83560_1 [Eumeta japonica]|uniref:Uncharacterized protein n=1 Tax=Eumeta variegata TaxID=151549 RepID=A0A4C1UNB2_EUMVA|nr:hypothetical protein EVAR_83560_1 [Eumeta japonica]